MSGPAVSVQIRRSSFLLSIIAIIFLRDFGDALQLDEKTSLAVPSFTLLSLSAVSAFRTRPCRAFTLIELLVVISIIAILIGLLFPAFKGVQDQAKKVQTKNDLTQIVTAVTAFYTEYGQYPCPPNNGDDGGDFVAADDSNQTDLMTELRAPSSAKRPDAKPSQGLFPECAERERSTKPRQRSEVRHCQRRTVVRRVGKGLPNQDRQQLQQHPDQSLHDQRRISGHQRRRHRVVVRQGSKGRQR